MTSAPGWLGVDMGGTATRWVWLGPDGRLLRGRAPGATAMLYDPARRAAFDAALGAVRAGLPGPVAAAHLGLTGAGFARDPALGAAAAAALGLDPGCVSHENDAELAHRAAFGAGPGHLVIAGTGSVGIGRTARGQAVVGGRGPLIDDRGSASWIAVQALQAVHRVLDATGSFDGVAALARALGADDWDRLRARVYGVDRGVLGLMAQDVAAAAAGGCPTAAAILTAAGRELAAMAGQLAARLGPAPVAVAGGVLSLAPQVRAGLLADCPEAALPDLDAPLAAAQAARARALAG
jgi:N-acetylglucosamine kinase-like BadF-type ATPase